MRDSHERHRQLPRDGLREDQASRDAGRRELAASRGQAASRRLEARPERETGETRSKRRKSRNAGQTRAKQERNDDVRVCRRGRQTEE